MALPLIRLGICGLVAGVGLVVGRAIAQAAAPPRLNPPQIAQAAETAALPEVWQAATAADQAEIWRYVLQSPMGVAALNQLAIEGFISPTCAKTLYSHRDYELFQTLLQVRCPTPRGVSAARAYDEMRVTFNRFEDTIHSFDIDRIYSD